MTVKELREQLATCPDDLEVFVPVHDAIMGWGFMGACSCETGLTELGEPREFPESFNMPVDTETKMVFLVAFHGFNEVFSGPEGDANPVQN